MTRVNIYLPSDLAEAVKEADINVSAIAQDALAAELGKRALITWLQRADSLDPVAAGFPAFDSLHVIRASRAGDLEARSPVLSPPRGEGEGEGE